MMELDVIGACMALGRFGRWGRHLIRLIGNFFSPIQRYPLRSLPSLLYAKTLAG
jgi:hypothetical protein